MEPDRAPPDWPFLAEGRRCRARPHDWWLAETGSGPTVLFLHGAGGSAHSFRALVPALPGLHAVLVDLPGQGLSRAGNRGRLGLDTMAEDLARLLSAEGLRPQAVIGHSAGAALALHLSTLVPLRAVAGINAALGSFEGAAGVLFPLLARLLSLTPLVPSFVSRMWGTEATVRRLVASTGSRLDAAGLAQYRALVADRDHVDGTLAMMAQWRLEGLLPALAATTTPVLLLATAGDRAVPARVSQEAAVAIPGAEVQVLPRLGHLAHEEAPDRIAAELRPWLARHLGG
jgi:magnesium chelatase accessory protein